MTLSPSLVPQRPCSNLGIPRGLFPIPIPFVFFLFVPVSTKPVSYLQNTSHEPENSRMQLRQGPIVLQERDRPFTLSDRRRYVDAVDLRPSIVFNIHDPHEERFSLSAAIPINAVSYDHHRPAMTHLQCACPDPDARHAITCQLPGYDHTWGLQTLTRDVHNPPVTATRAKLAKDVAKSVSRFLAVRALSLCIDQVLTGLP